MKKLFCIFTINLILLLMLMMVLEICLYYHHKKSYPEIAYIIKKFNYKDILSMYKLRPVEGINYSKSPLIVFGCSYAYGQGLNIEQTFGYKLSAMTKRPVYNYSLPGKGLQNTLYMLQNNMTDPNIKNPEYIIYIFMYDQIRRLYSTVCFHDFTGYPVYKMGNDGLMHLKQDYYPIYKQFYTYYFFNNIFYIYVYSHFMKKHSKLICAYFNTINAEIKKKYPDTNFVILMYDANSNNFGLNFSSIDKSIKIINTKDLSDISLSKEEYHLKKDDFHPNEKAWDVLLPPLIKTLNL